MVYSVDAISEKSPKHVEHRTKIITLVPSDVRKELLVRAKGNSND